MNGVFLCKYKIFRMSTRYILIRLQEVNLVSGSFSLTDSFAFVATQRDDLVQWTRCHVVGRDAAATEHLGQTINLLKYGSD